MASSSSALLSILFGAEQIPSTPTKGALSASVENVTGGRRWTQGQGTGQVDVVYMSDQTMAASETDSYNTLSAGSLTDLLGQAVDLDELKCLIVKCNTGTIALEAPASNALGIFSSATDLINLGAGQMVVFDFGAGGLDVTANSKLDIIEKAAAAATYTLAFIGAN